MATSLDALVKEFKAKEEAARLSNMKREDQITAIYDEIIQRYQPGGGFESAALGQIGKQKTQDVGQGMQNLISSGLFGTEAAAGLGAKWESTVGSNARLGIQDTMMERLSGAQANKAGFIQSIENSYPDYGPLMAAAQAQGQNSYRGGSWTEAPKEPEMSYADLKSMYGKPAAATGRVGADYYTARGLSDPRKKTGTTTTAAVTPVADVPVESKAQNIGQPPSKSYMSPYVYSQEAIKAEDARYAKALAAYNAQKASTASPKPVRPTIQSNKYQSSMASGITKGDTFTNMQRAMTTPKYKSSGVGGSW